MFYSKQTNGFYSREIHGDNIPEDAVEITPEQHAALLRGQSECKQITADENGYPILQDSPQPTPEQLADTARHERDQLIESVRWRIERHNDELALGSEPTELLEPLLQYTQALRDVPQQAGFPESVEWPQCP
ncbi:MAG TPA: phage tail assembly chaperone [Thiopseudomonas sp.]|nr:phage tail assembly chaperone [Thiopseudomonas sp.]